MSTHVLDTCALLDLAAGRWRVSAVRQELIAARDPSVLCVSVWEIARKVRIGKLTLPCAQDEILDFVKAVCQHYQLRLASLDERICHNAELLHPWHEDPFDRMIIAFALSTKAPVFTTDKRFLSYPIKILSHR